MNTSSKTSSLLSEVTTEWGNITSTRILMTGSVCRLTLALPFVLTALGYTTATRANTIHVPATFPTVQSAINAAAPSDTILVANGTYFENLVLKSNLVLRSASGPTQAVLDGQSVGSVISADGVVNVAVEGFTIRNGRGSNGNLSKHGGGLGLANCDSTVHVKDNLILENIAWDGGAIWIGHGTGPLIEGNTFSRNEAEGQTPNAYGVGGAIIADGSSSLRPVIRDNIFLENHSDRGGSAIDCFNYTSPVIEGNVFIANTCSDTSPPYAGVLIVGGGHAVIVSNTFVFNTGGYGIMGTNASTMAVSQVLMATNELTASVGCFPDASAQVSCSNFYSNALDDWSDCVSSQLGLDGNISLDPLFCDALGGDFRLRADSPCAPELSGNCGLIGALPIGCPPSSSLSQAFASNFTLAASSTGAAFLDIDSDGDLDLHVLRDQLEPDQTYRNDGESGFATVTSSLLQDPGRGEGMDWGDFDNDGLLDLYVVNSTTANRLYRNLGGGNFADVTSPPLDFGSFDQGATWIDVDRDGLLDVYLTTHFAANRLYRNMGGGSFVDATPPALAVTLNCGSSAWGDYDSDGDCDAFIGVQNGPDVLARNDGTAGFSNVTPVAMSDAGIAQGAAWGDFDNDADLDLYVCNFGTPNRLYRNDAGAFVDIATGDLADAGNGQSGTWADFDNDGDLDLVLTNFGQPNALLRNNGAGTFERLAIGAPSDSSNSVGASWGDYDLDGDLDLFIARFGSADRLYRNDSPAGNHWIQIALEGAASNRSAIGARITLIDLPSGATQIREHGSNHGFWSCNQPAEHFGLGELDRVDVLSVRWPSGAIEFFYDVPADLRLHIVEGGGIVGAPAVVASSERAFSRPNPFRRSTEIVWAPDRPGKAHLTIFDVAGRLVRNLTGNVPGAIQWDGRNSSGSEVPQGIYFYRIESGIESQAGKLVRVR